MRRDGAIGDDDDTDLYGDLRERLARDGAGRDDGRRHAAASDDRPRRAVQRRGRRLLRGVGPRCGRRVRGWRVTMRLTPTPTPRGAEIMITRHDDDIYTVTIGSQPIADCASRQ